MQTMERGLGQPLEWAAVIHHNTDHAHAHVALRGKLPDGQTLRLSREYIKHGVRDAGENLCTRQLGFRSLLDAKEAQLREVQELRFTSLDRRILRSAQPSEAGGLFYSEEPDDTLVASRLRHLQELDLAKRVTTNSWFVESNAEQALRAMQRVRDRQRTLADHGAPVSDPQLPMEAINWQETPSIEGRILVHGQDEQSGKSYLMLEATSAKVLYIPYTREMEEARSRGGLKINSFTRLLRTCLDEEPVTAIQDLGGAENFLKNRRLLRERIQAMRSNCVGPAVEGWAGWLGRYQKAVSTEYERSLENASQRPKHPWSARLVGQSVV